MASEEIKQHNNTNPWSTIFSAFFRPGKLSREIQSASTWQRLLLIYKTFPIILACLYSTVIGTQILLLFLHFSISSTHFGGYPDYSSLNPFQTILIGVVLGFAIGFSLGSVYDFAFGITFGVALGLALGFAFGFTSRLTFGLASAILGGGIFGLALGSAFTISDDRLGINPVIGITLCSVAFSSGAGFAFGLQGIVAFLFMSLTGGFLGSIRLHFYIVSALSLTLVHISSRRRPQDVFILLHRSSLYWDELAFPVLPFLKDVLLTALIEDEAKALEEIAFIEAERPRQLSVARAVLLETALHDLEMYKSLSQIAQATQRLGNLFPTETKLIDPRWKTTLARLSDASREAQRSLLPIGRQRRDALSVMLSNLARIHTNVAFQNQKLNLRLQSIVDTWRQTAQNEFESFEQTYHDVGYIDNPYKPGIVLQPQDTLFVGRRDLAQQLEYALGQDGRRPTFLLNGERRMGKTSTLHQLPILLGSRRIPVFYNLQDPKIYKSTSTLLRFLASGIHSALIERGLYKKNLSIEEIREGNISNAYAIFDRWLQKVERMLEQEDRMLLLLFDEFEKLDEVTLKGHFEISFWLDWCRQIIQYHPRIALLFSGIHTFGDMGITTGLNWSSYFVNVQELRVSFLEPEEARHVILHPVAHYQGATIFSDAIVNRIIYLTNSHPFLVQALCAQLIDNLNSTKRQHTTLDDVEKASKQVIEAWNSYFDDLWRRSSEGQKVCLRAFCTEEILKFDDIKRMIDDESQVRNSIQALQRRDLIFREDLTYRISTPIFHQWIQANS